MEESAVTTDGADVDVVVVVAAVVVVVLEESARVETMMPLMV